MTGRRNNKYGRELKKQAVEEYLSGAGGGLRAVSKKYGIRDKKTLRMWIMVYNGLDQCQ